MLRGRSLALVGGAVATVAAVVGCGSKASPSPASSSSPSASVAAAPAPSASASAGKDAPLPTDPPVVIDKGPGRATAALRSALGAYHVAFDEAELAKACKVGPDGASIDDIEEAARGQGLAATQVVLPPEHVASADVLPAIVALGGQFVLAWRVDGDEVVTLHPTRGRERVARAAFEAGMLTATVAVPAAAQREALASQPARAAFAARAARAHVDAGEARTLLGEALADPTMEGLAAYDAALRVTARGAAKPGVALRAAFACARTGACDGVKIPDDAWFVRRSKAKVGATVTVRGAVALTLGPP